MNDDLKILLERIKITYNFLDEFYFDGEISEEALESLDKSLAAFNVHDIDKSIKHLEVAAYDIQSKIKSLKEIEYLKNAIRTWNDLKNDK